MSKPTKSILCRDESQSGRDGLLESLVCASTHALQQGLQFGEGLFNGKKNTLVVNPFSFLMGVTN